ncbi:MAG: DUF1232 domain-containing protein [Hyphomicrobiales bacterium]|uniref:YkvA family protein n=1 Tax=Rhabdaerophilum calidifontis TaxID=2604328 RepID=UPI001FE5BAF9|nr:DUF1232 domain-containing protein [Rhabdaerophilum calidifontis]MCA2000138.1 DUF1232 domain-containing protein [Hyphomicrobiales bacterium]
MRRRDMAERWQEPFSKAEMARIRAALRDEPRLLDEALALARRLARALPFAEDVVAAYHCVRDPATSPRVKMILLGALAYFVMPLDAMPDVLPVFGFTDDAAVLAAALTAVRGAIRPEHRARAREALAEEGPASPGF